MGRKKREENVVSSDRPTTVTAILSDETMKDNLMNDNENEEVTGESSSEYLNNIILDWQRKAPRERGRLRDTDLVRLIQVKTGKKIANSTIGKWLKGEKIPNFESTRLIIDTFGSDPEETYKAFGHEYYPQITYQGIYDQTKAAIEEWKQGLRPNENWSVEFLTDDPKKPVTHEWLLGQLALYTDPEWMGKMPPIVKAATDAILQSGESVQAKALMLCIHSQIASMYQFLPPEDED
jgi:hypothetical protein